MAGLGGDPQFPQLLLHLGHEVQDPGLDGAEIVVFELLVLGGRRAEKGPARLEQIGPLEIETAVDEEILLFHAQCDGNLFVTGQSEALHQAAGRPRKSLDGTEKGSLFVQCLARVAAKSGGDAQGRPVAVTLDEGGTGGIPGGVAPGLEGGTQSAGRKTGGVGFPHDEVLARKGEDGPAAGRLQERVVLFGGPPGEGLEPVGVTGGAPAQSPLFHGMGHVSGDGGIQSFAPFDGPLQFAADLLGKKFLHDFGVENVRTVFPEFGGHCLPGRRDNEIGDGFHGFTAAWIAHFFSSRVDYDYLPILLQKACQFRRSPHFSPASR